MSIEFLSDEQREIGELARRFADEQVAPHAARWDRDHEFPRETLTALGELGLMGVCVPTELAGSGADLVSYTLVLEQISRADAGLGTALAVHTGAGTMPIIVHGSDEQRQRLVPPLAQGHEIAAFALTEAGSGSDAGASSLREGIHRRGRRSFPAAGCRRRSIRRPQMLPSPLIGRRRKRR